MPSHASFLDKLQTIASYDYNNYYLTYHKNRGFDLEQKRNSSIYIISAVIDPIIRAFKAFFGQSYSFDDNITRLVKCLKNACDDYVNVQGYVEACNRLSKIATRVLKKKYKDSEPVTDRIRGVKFGMLEKRAELDGISSFECACKYNVLPEAAVLLGQDKYMLTISQESKNKLLGYFLDEYDIKTAERVIKAGGDPLSQMSKLSTMIPRFFSKNYQPDCFNEYFILPNQGFYTLEKQSEDIDVSAKVLKPLLSSWNYRYQSYDKFALAHTVHKVMAHVEAHWAAIANPKEFLGQIRALYTKLGAARHELAEDVQYSIYLYLSSKAAAEDVDPLQFALNLDLIDDALYLIDQGADFGELTQDAKTKLLGYYLENDLEIACELIVLGADPSVHKQLLRPLLHHCIKNKDELAIRLLDAGASRAASANDKDDTALFAAVRYGNLAVVQKLEQMGESLSQRGLKEKTALHVAAKYNQFELLDFLVTKIDVSSVDANGLPAFEFIQDTIWFTNKSDLEQAFLDVYIKRCRELLRKYSEENAKLLVEDLKKKYPASSVDHLLYTVNRSHFQNRNLVVLPAAVAPGIYLDQLLGFLDQMNFTDAYGEAYVDPKEFEIDTKTRDPKKLKEYLNGFINNIKKRVAFLGTPRPGPSLEVFYHAMERAVTHTIKTINEMQDGPEKVKVRNYTLVQYLRASTYCGGKQYATACQQYVAVTTGQQPTFEDVILDILGNYREVLFQTLIPAGYQSVHDFNKMMKHLGVELGIPGAEMMQDFEDIYGVNALDFSKLKIDFLKLYSSRNIIFECVKQNIEQSSEMREKLFDWFKQNVPQSWKDRYIAGIRHEVAEKETLELKKAYLETQDISLEENQTIDDAINALAADNATLAYRYLGLEVVVDMASPKFQIKPSAIAYMLHKMNILTPVYKWDYSLASFGGGVLSGAWKGFKNILGSIFSQ